GAGVGGSSTEGARTGGTEVGDPDPRGTPSGDTGNGGANCEETGGGLPACTRGARAIGGGAARVGAVGLAGAAGAAAAAAAAAATAATAAPCGAAVSPPAFGPAFSPLNGRPAVWSSPPTQSPPPVVRHYRSRPCPPSARPSSPVADIYSALLCTSFRRSPPLVFFLPSPPPSSLLVPPTPISEYYRAVRPVVSRVLATVVTDPQFSPSSISALTATLADFAATSRLDYSTRVVPAPPIRPLPVWGEFSLGCDILEDRHSELEYLAVASFSLCAMLIFPEGDPDALDIPTLRRYCEAL
ncbi:unnamed protein product, partial [Closterium sp. NIES-54]